VDEKASWFRGWMETPVGRVARVATELTLCDTLGNWGVRWGINRMHYTVPAGLFAVGEPGPDSPVLVTANYKLTFDVLRRQLAGKDLWLLVLETFGINVWCAAGKGTFGTLELINRIERVQVGRLVHHRCIVLPQLGGPGVAAHEVRKLTGFRVEYGPIRARDLPLYLEHGMKAAPEMRRVRFGLRDRLAVTPVELVNAWKPSLVVCLVILALSSLRAPGFRPETALSLSAAPLGIYLGTLLLGSVVTPILLPWIPGRPFAVKGAQLGLLWALLANFTMASGWSGAERLSLFLVAPALTAYFAMNFTGSTTFTSLSGVEKEMRLALPVIILCAIAGGAVWLAGIFL
jgi:hypothetical protein